MGVEWTTFGNLQIVSQLQVLRGVGGWREAGKGQMEASLKSFYINSNANTVHRP